MEEEKTIEPTKEKNGKTLKIIFEICQFWGLFYKVQRFNTLLINNLSNKGYTINLKIKGTFFGEGAYNIYLNESSPKNAIFTNSKEISEQSQCINGTEIDENNVDKVIEFIESKV